MSFSTVLVIYYRLILDSLVQFAASMEQSSSSGQHAEPVNGSNCMCCWDDLESSNYAEYRVSTNSDWLPSGYCTGKNTLK